MPYNREKAGKGGHSDLVQSAHVQDFLSDCEYIKEASDEDGKAIVDAFSEVVSDGGRPRFVFASDASPYAEPINGKFPSTQIGYVKVSLVLVDLDKYDGLSGPGNRYIDPHKVAELHRGASSFAFTLPGSNVHYKKATSVKNGFRNAVFDQLSDTRTSPRSTTAYTVVETLLAISGNSIEVSNCPSCEDEPTGGFSFSPTNRVIECAACKEKVYVTDSLRIHEQISDFGDNLSAMTRFMNVSEHLIMANYIRFILENNPKALGNMAFIIDGPLAIFGQPAKVHARLMAFYADVATKLKEKGLIPPVIVGLQKDGMVMEHARSILRFLTTGSSKDKNVYRPVDDEYRNKYISEVTSTNFGNETYYGQDFIYKTKSGRIFVVGIPYPFNNKMPASMFASKKSEAGRYENLATALELIHYLEFDLYDNAIIPVALAHRHASLSVMPGGKVLDLLSRIGLDKN